MTVARLMSDLAACGVDLWLEADGLRLSAPTDVLTPSLREALAEDWTDILDCLRAATSRSEDWSSPLSLNQQALYFLHTQSPASAAYNLGVALRLRSALSLGALRLSVQALVARHPMLRTTFEDGPEGPVQFAREPGQVALESIDVSQLTDDEVRMEVERCHRQPFDLRTGPVLRAALFTRSESDHVLLLAVHHIVADRRSVRLMLEELGTLYRGFASGRPAVLPHLDVTYADFVRRQRDMLDGPEGQRLKAYWLGQLNDLPAPLDLPGDRGRLGDGDKEGGRTITCELSERLSSSLKDLARDRGSTLFAVLMSAFQVLLSRHSGRTQILVGTPASSSSSAFRSTLGDFTNPVVVRGSLDGNPNFCHFLRGLDRTIAEAVAHGAYPFVSVVQSLSTARDPNRSPVFQAMFDLQTHWSTDLSGLFDPRERKGTSVGSLYAEPYLFPQPEGQVDLALEIVDLGPTLIANLSYQAARFERSTIEQMRGHFETLLEGIVADPNRRVSELPLLTAAEESRILHEWNGAVAAYPAALGLDGMFEAQVSRSPDRVAVIQGGCEMTYAVLNDRANQIARRLRALGVGPGVLVAVGLSRTPDLVAALLAVAKAGGAYLPIDAAYPAQRVAWMLEDAKPSVLLTERALATTWPQHAARMLLDDPDERLADQHGADHADHVARAGPDAPAYVIFTSGSTGRPKGVQISRRALVNFLAAMQQEPGLSQRDRLLAVTTLSFDIAVLELFVPLVTGASIVLATRDEAADGDRLARLLVESGATVMQATPATWRMVVDAGWTGSASFRVLCGGEPMPRDLADALLDRAAEVWNLYGPTETTVWATQERVRRGAPITVGRPIANTQVYVLGHAGELQPAGVIGDVWIGGDCVADGYVGRTDLTAERFVRNPYVPGTRMYATGDIARWTPDGRLDHLGRSDDQVKVRGFRVELGEVENALLTHPSVRQAAAVAFGAAGDVRIVAYVVPAGKGIDAAALRRHARDRLPEYMVPAVVFPLAALPATSNGKLDRKTLLASTAEALLHAGAASPRSRAPRTPVEDTLASIWADVLGVKEVGIDDDFFDLGGHSLLAARLMQQTSDVFWVKLPLRLLFEAPTIARIAVIIEQRLEAKQSDESISDVLEINTSGARQPFVFLHHANARHGNGFYCFNLARHLGEDQPMYGLAPLGLDGTGTPPTVEAIAAKQLQIIRRIQPSGPYYLGGFCGSGPVAFELARTLKTAGERVEIVVVIESSINECNRAVRFADRAAGALARVARLGPAQRLRVFHIVHRAARMSASTVRADATAVVKKARSFASTRLGAIKQMCVRAGDRSRAATTQDDLSFAVLQRYDRAIDGFVPQAYDGRVVYVKAEASPFDSTAAWRRVAPQLRVLSVKGDHNTCITTRVDCLGSELRSLLREAQEGA